MSDHTSSSLPLDSRQYKCGKHLLYEDPSRCSTCENNRRQRQLERERAAASRETIEQATVDYGSGLNHRNLEEDISKSGTTSYGELRNSIRDPLYGAPGSASESYYRSHDIQRVHDTGSAGNPLTRSIFLRDPFESSREADRNQFGDVRVENTARNNPATVQYAEQPPPNDFNLDSMGPRGRRNALSGNSGGGWHHSQCPQQ